MNLTKHITSNKSRRVFWALFCRGIGVVLQFSVNIVIGQLFGVKGMGVYHIYSTCMVMLADVTSLGLPVYTMRKISTYKNEQKYQQISIILKQYLLLGIISSLLLATPFILSSHELSDFFLNNIEDAYILKYAAIAAILYLSIRIISVALKAIGLTNLGILSESAILPFFVLLSIGLTKIITSIGTPETLITIHISSLALVVILLYIFWIKQIKTKIKQCVITNEEVNKIHGLKRSMLFIWCSMIINIWFTNLPVFILPQFVTTEEIGLFGVAFRLVILSTTILVSLSALFGPQFISLFKNNSIQSLKKELKHSQWYSLIAYLPFFITFVIFPEAILSVFGEEFIDAKNLLLILAVSHLINSATGLSGYFLLMTHNEKSELLILFSTFIFILPFIFLSGNHYGILGVTTVYAIGIAIKNISSLIFAHYVINQLEKRGDHNETT
ncbi:MAG: hypothetical protein LC437_02615 [Thiohalomonas sp.]|nr:hypothetical protein [Thiohalomonas sp.]